MRSGSRFQEVTSKEQLPCAGLALATACGRRRGLGAGRAPSHAAARLPATAAGLLDGVTLFGGKESFETVATGAAFSSALTISSLARLRCGLRSSMLGFGLEDLLLFVVFCAIYTSATTHENTAALSWA